MKIVTHRTSIDFFLTCQTVSRAHDAESNWPILEHLLAECADVYEVQNQTLSSIEHEQHDQTRMVEQNMQAENKSLPSIESTQPETTALGNPGGKGFEWYKDAQETLWHRNEGSKSEWPRLDSLKYRSINNECSYRETFCIYHGKIFRFN